MKVDVRLFAIRRDRAGTAPRRLALTEGATFPRNPASINHAGGAITGAHPHARPARSAAQPALTWAL